MVGTATEQSRVTTGSGKRRRSPTRGGRGCPQIPCQLQTPEGKEQLADMALTTCSRVTSPPPGQGSSVRLLGRGPEKNTATLLGAPAKWGPSHGDTPGNPKSSDHGRAISAQFMGTQRGDEYRGHETLAGPGWKSGLAEVEKVYSHTWSSSLGFCCYNRTPRPGHLERAEHRFRDLGRPRAPPAVSGPGEKRKGKWACVRAEPRGAACVVINNLLSPHLTAGESKTHACEEAPTLPDDVVTAKSILPPAPRQSHQWQFKFNMSFGGNTSHLNHSNNCILYI